MTLKLEFEKFKEEFLAFEKQILDMAHQDSELISKKAYELNVSPRDTVALAEYLAFEYNLCEKHKELLHFMKPILFKTYDEVSKMTIKVKHI